MSSVGLSRLDVDSYYNFEGVEAVKLALARESLGVNTLALTEVELDLLRKEEGPVSEKSKGSRPIIFLGKLGILSQPA